MCFSNGVFAKKEDLNSLLNSIKKSKSENCAVNSLQIPQVDSVFKMRADFYLNMFGSMSLNDFDAGQCLSDKNITNDILTLSLYQNNKSMIGYHLKTYIAYSLITKEILIVVSDDDKKTYLLGNKNQELVGAISRSFDGEISKSQIDMNSKLTFKDMGKDFKPDLNDQENNRSFQSYNSIQADIVAEASKNIKKRNAKDLIKADKSYNYIFDGDNKSTVSIIIKMDSAIDIPLSKSEVEGNLELPFSLIKQKLKNPYSFKPRTVVVKQSGTSLEYAVKYTAQNSYGADVVGVDKTEMYLWSDGKYHTNPSK